MTNFNSKPRDKQVIPPKTFEDHRILLLEMMVDSERRRNHRTQQLLESLAQLIIFNRGNDES